MLERCASATRRAFPALLALVLAGCFPYSCNRSESRALMPADSLSRTLADAMPVDTLEVLNVPDLPGAEYPRTVAFAPDGTLWVADTGSQRLYAVSGGSLIRTVELDTLRYPYIAGFRDGEPVVFSPDAGRIVALAGGLGVSTPADVAPRTLQYVAVDDSLVWVKLAGQEYDSRALLLAADGSEMARVPLPDPWWRWAGALRLHRGQPVSLSGYRPQFYVLAESGIDSTALVGFDSPMLPRSRAFLRGETHQPPLLSSSAAFLGDALWTLNVRPGWLRVDVFGGDGHLARILVEPNPAFGKEFYPTDIAVRADSLGGVLVAVTVAEPVAGVRLYRAVAAR